MPEYPEPIFTRQFQNTTNFTPEEGSNYLFGISVEDRSSHVFDLMARSRNIHFIEIINQTISNITVKVNDDQYVYNLRDERQLHTILDVLPSRFTYLDVTGLSNHIWARLIQIFIKYHVFFKVVYVEPQKYKFSKYPTEGEIFDLSDRIEGIRPMPGFFPQIDLDNVDKCFIPLLGFEGTRISYIFENIDPPGDRIYPIIGLPGFRPEYIYYAYLGNKPFLRETKSWRHIRYAKANCPFSLFYTLSEIAMQFNDNQLVIAPIGTKPHALGAILFAIKQPNRVEIIYDHPVRKPERTIHTDKLLIYDIPKFLDK